MLEHVEHFGTYKLKSFSPRTAKVLQEPWVLCMEDARVEIAPELGQH